MTGNRTLLRRGFRPLADRRRPAADVRTLTGFSSPCPSGPLRGKQSPTRGRNHERVESKGAAAPRSDITGGLPSPELWAAVTRRGSS